MPRPPLFTIGHGDLPRAGFVALLQDHDIAYLIDVRSHPDGGDPDYAREPLAAALRAAGISYVFMGRELGERPADPACYTNGRVDSSRLQAQPSFQAGLDRLENAWRQGLRVALLGKPGRPESCHRARVIGAALVGRGITVAHIDRDGQIVPQETVAARPRPEPEAGPDLPAARELLHEVFGFDAFRPLQEAIVTNVLRRRDTLVVMPTGSGKSLCYQLPALLSPGLTVVVSPLISLMQDQVEALRQLGVAAEFLNSTLDFEEAATVRGRLMSGAVRLLYAAPETLLRPDTMALLAQCRVDCLTIDEAHCISEWGHDFRPEYRQLVDLRRRLPAAVCLAVTATATEHVRRDIAAALGIAAVDEFIASFDRPNLFLAATFRTAPIEQVLAFLRQHRDESGIIYCRTRNQVERLATSLRRRGWAALPYHAGLEDEVRRQHQRRFVTDETPIMVATIAFGMGIDKSNVRFVLHVGLPQSIEAYYQQIGRAGRDGLPADCLLLYTYGDAKGNEQFHEAKDETLQRGASLRQRALLDYVNAETCRRRPLLAYFDETYPEAPCDNCDNCRQPPGDRAGADDLTAPAQMFLACVLRTGELFGTHHIIDVLRGSRAQAVLSRGHDRLPMYDAGGAYTKQGWLQIAGQLLGQGLLRRDMTHGSLKLTPRGRNVLDGASFFGTAPVERPAPAARPGPAVARSASEGAALAPADHALFEALREKRRELAAAQGVPPYIVFSDRSLQEMAARRPASRAAFAEIHGVGAFKLEKYADAFLAVIAAHARAPEDPAGLTNLQGL